MDDLDKEMLQNFNGLEKNNLTTLIGETDDESLKLLTTDSHYVKPPDLPAYVHNLKHDFSIYSLNVCSIGAEGKFEQIRCLLADFQSKGIYFSAICIQETWLRGDIPDTS